MPSRSCIYGLFAAVAITATSVTAYQHTALGVKLKKSPPVVGILWRDPGNVASLDFKNGIGGRKKAPAPPFRFIKEDMGGTSPKVMVRDAKGQTWSVKFGVEAKPEVFADRLVWACGYFTETDYFVGAGQISGVTGLKRAAPYVQNGRFTDARFELRDERPKFLRQFNWTWTNNPFVGTRELNGLKVLMMLLSNWDAKDARDLDRESHKDYADSNLGVFEEKTPVGPVYLYAVTDWGASLGKWGSLPYFRDKWDCAEYTAQTPQFVEGSEDGCLKFSFSGRHTSDIRDGISIYDAQWLLQYLGRVTDKQLRAGLVAAGARPGITECYLTEVRRRIDKLRQVAGTPRGFIPAGKPASLTPRWRQSAAPWREIR